MKKLLLGLGTLVAIAAPITTIVSCGGNGKTKVKSFDPAQTPEKTTEVAPSDYKQPEQPTVPESIGWTGSNYESEQTGTGKTSILQETLDDLSDIDITNEIQNEQPYTNLVDVNAYVMPPIISFVKNSIQFEATFSNFVTDSTTGTITFDADISKDSKIVKTFSSIALFGFEQVLDNKQKIDFIQRELDSQDNLEISSSKKTIAQVSEQDIQWSLNEIIYEDYGFTPIVSNLQKTSGKVTFDLSYEAIGEDGTTIQAKKTMTVTGFISDLEMANTLQDQANKWSDGYGTPSSSQIFIAEDDSRISGGEFKVTESVAKELGFETWGKSLLLDDSNCDLSITINPKTLMGTFSVKYNGVESTIDKVSQEITTQEKSNFKILSSRRTYNDGQTAVKLPTDFKFPKGLIKLPEMSFAGYIIPKGFVFPEGITTISHGAFAGAVIEEGVKLPSTISIVDDAAFEYATVPASMSLPEGVETLGHYAFAHAKIADNYSLPNSIKNIGEDYQFYLATIGKNFKLPETLDVVAGDPFSGATIGEGIILPTKIKTVNMYQKEYSTSDCIFQGAKLPSFIDVSKLSIDNIYGGTQNNLKDAIDFMFKDSTTTDGMVPNYVTHLRSSLLESIKPSWNSQQGKLPSGFKITNNIKYIDRRAFFNFDVTGLIIPDSVIEIGKQAFEGAKMSESFRLPSHLEKIGIDAFYNDGIYDTVKFSTGFTIPDSVTSIGDGAFARVEFSSGFTIGSGVKRLGFDVFAKAKFASDFKLPSTVEELVDQPFEQADLPSGYKNGSKARVIISPSVKSESSVGQFGHI